VNLNDAPTDDADWDTMECTVRSWMYAAIVPDLLNDGMMPSASACRVWLDIEDQFFGNKETHVLILNTEFYNFMQGDLPVSEYYRRLKYMANSLGDLGEPVLNRTHILSVLCGLNEKFAYMGAILKHHMLFPSFGEVNNDLMVEEISMAKPAALSQALVTTAPHPPATGSLRHHRSTSSCYWVGSERPSTNAAPCSYAGPKKKNKNKKNNTLVWPSFCNPWISLIQMWSGVPCGPLPGSRPLGP
jgi:hypothetical protein